MKAITTAIPDVLVVESVLYCDARGYFFESYNRREFAEIGITGEFVQDNQSRSARNVVRGLHYQIQQSQGKLVRVLAGSIFDVAVDLRRSSPTFGCWVGKELSAENRRMLWIPRGFAHGFAVLSEEAEIAYKTDAFYAREHERSIIWNDPDLNIAWPLETPLLSPKDAGGCRFCDAEVFP